MNHVETMWITREKIKIASDLLKSGELAAFPTETVYGLGADARNQGAVAKIFKAKGRPADNPLIVHLHDINQVNLFTDQIPSKARQLMDAFWPGPLTIILNHTTGLAANNVTAGLDTIGLRIPSHPLAQKLLKISNIPLAAPSANISGKPSPTSADHVWHDLKGKVAGVVDGGPTGVGLESTVIDLSDKFHPIILRPGGVSKEEIEAVIGYVASSNLSKDEIDQPKAPGMKYRHYSPDKPVYIIDDTWKESIAKLLKSNQKIGILATDKILKQFEKDNLQVFSLGKEGDVRSASQLLYKGLRYFDESSVTAILAQAFPKEGLGVAYMNRLEKAASN